MSQLLLLNQVVEAIGQIGRAATQNPAEARARILAAMAPLAPAQTTLHILPPGQSASPWQWPLTPDWHLVAELPPDHTLSTTQQALLANAAMHAGAWLAQIEQAAHMQRSLQRKEEELNRLRRADMLISSRLGLEETLEAILQMALEVTGARYGIFRLLDDHGQLITRAFAGEDLDRPATEALPLDETSITGLAAVQRRTLCIPDVLAPPWSQLYYPLDHQSPMRSELVTPLIAANGRLEGVINLESPEVAAFTQADAQLLQSFAIQAVIAIQEARLLDALQDLSVQLLTGSAAAAFERVIQLGRELLGAAQAGLWWWQDGELRLQTYLPQEAAPPSPVTTWLRAQLTASPPPSGPIASSSWHGVLMAPLISGNQEHPKGALAVLGTASDPLVLSDWDKKVLALLARHAALAADNARRQEALRLAQEQRAATETLAALGDITANLLHQLNNKLGLIPVRIEGLEDKRGQLLAQDPYLAHNLASIRTAALESLDIVRESFTHLRPITLTAASLPEAVAQALAEIAPPPSIRIQQQNLEHLPLVVAGRRRLVLVFHNLLENAVTAMPHGGTITLRGRVQGPWVEVVVEDTGPGIPAELREAIFQFNFSGRRHAGKLGFGLWWVKTIMARFGGSIQLQDSPAGARFLLRFAIAENA